VHRRSYDPACVVWQIALCDLIWQVMPRSYEMSFPWKDRYRLSFLNSATTNVRCTAECRSRSRCRGRRPCGNTFAGRHPLSEPETVAVANFIMSRREAIRLYVSLHSYSQLWLTPWGYTTTAPPDNSDLVVVVVVVIVVVIGLVVVA